jgi:hypothetical protein
MDDKIQQRLDAIMGPAKKARPSQSTAKLPDNSQWLLVFSALLAFRIVNALTIKTFFQPDEYFQALEPAWKTAFGGGSGAWTTWVRKTHPIWRRCTLGSLPSSTKSPMPCRRWKAPLELPGRRICSLHLRSPKRFLPLCWTSTPGS